MSFLENPQVKEYAWQVASGFISSGFIWSQVRSVSDKDLKIFHCHADELKPHVELFYLLRYLYQCNNLLKQEQLNTLVEDTLSFLAIYNYVVHDTSKSTFNDVKNSVSYLTKIVDNLTLLQTNARTKMDESEENMEMESKTLIKVEDVVNLDEIIKNFLIRLRKLNTVIDSCVHGQKRVSLDESLEKFHCPEELETS